MPKEPDNIQHYELLKIILDFIGTVIWPIIIVILVSLFKTQIREFFTRAKKLELPGGFSVEIENDIQQAKELATEIKTDRKPEIEKFIKEKGVRFQSDANMKMLQLGLTPSPSGLDLNYYKSISETDPRLAIVGLRSDLEIMLRNLAKGFSISIKEKDSAAKIVSLLYENGAITSKQFEFMNTLFRIGNAAAHGIQISREQTIEVLEIAEVLVKDYIAWLYWGFRK
ncbi:MAG: DUF4145 domain-containing protein [Janthinobacterium lividum]